LISLLILVLNLSYSKRKKGAAMKYIINCFRNYALFEGRARRSEFWSFAALFTISLLLANYIDNLDGQQVEVAAGMGIIELLVFIILILPSLSSGARRLHDTNRSGWWMMLLYIPYLAWILSKDNERAQIASAGGLLVGFVALLILLLLPGDTDENRFGMNPRYSFPS
jgi:uncharacterized membrane protein YhaH (DUF805 family)